MLLSGLGPAFESTSGSDGEVGLGGCDLLGLVLLVSLHIEHDLLVVAAILAPQWVGTSGKT